MFPGLDPRAGEVATPVSFSRALRLDSSLAFSASAPLPLGSNLSFLPVKLKLSRRLGEVVLELELDAVMLLAVMVNGAVGDVGEDGKLGDESIPIPNPDPRPAGLFPNLRFGKEMELDRVCECLFVLDLAGVGGDGDVDEGHVG
jgi:hypothetical protein